MLLYHTLNGRMSDFQRSYVETMFHEHVATRYPGLEFNSRLENKNIPYREKTTVYQDGRTKITAYKRDTWHLDDYDTFTKYEIFVDGKLVHTEDD